MEAYKGTHPMDICLLCPYAVMLIAEPLAPLVQDLDRAERQ